MARKPWSELTPTYRHRLERAGITPAMHARRESLAAARGHARTPEHPVTTLPRKRMHGTYRGRSVTQYRTNDLRASTLRKAIARTNTRPGQIVRIAIVGKISARYDALGVAKERSDLDRLLTQYENRPGGFDALAFANDLDGGGGRINSVERFTFAFGAQG